MDRILIEVENDTCWGIEGDLLKEDVWKLSKLREQLNEWHYGPSKSYQVYEAFIEPEHNLFEDREFDEDGHAVEFVSSREARNLPPANVQVMIPNSLNKDGTPLGGDTLLQLLDKIRKYIVDCFLESYRVTIGITDEEMELALKEIIKHQSDKKLDGREWALNELAKPWAFDELLRYRSFKRNETEVADINMTA